MESLSLMIAVVIITVLVLLVFVGFSGNIFDAAGRMASFLAGAVGTFS